MKNKAKINYWIDILIGVGFAVSAISGIVLIFIPSGGFQGGRNAAAIGYEFLGLNRFVWKDLHTWSSVGAALGVLFHMILHWNWFVCMTKNLFKPNRRVATARIPSQPATVSTCTSAE